MPTGRASPRIGILLKPERSGLRLVEHVVAADRLDFGVAFEPRRKSVEAALPLLRRLEELNPYSHGHIRDYDWEVVDTAAARVAAAADLNEAMDALAAVAPEGLRLLTGQYGVTGRRALRGSGPPRRQALPFMG